MDVRQGHINHWSHLNHVWHARSTAVVVSLMYVIFWTDQLINLGNVYGQNFHSLGLCKAVYCPRCNDEELLRWILAMLCRRWYMYSDWFTVIFCLQSALKVVRLDAAWRAVANVTQTAIPHTCLTLTPTSATVCIYCILYSLSTECLIWQRLSDSLVGLEPSV